MHTFFRFSATLPIVLLLLGGCATNGSRLSEEQLARHLLDAEIKANQLLAEGKSDEAIGVLVDAAGVNPARKEPWVRMARIHFDNERYGQAIVASAEVLQRDPDDNVAKSVRAVSGLRVATDALWDLRGDAESTGSAREDAENLAKVLRETLGEEVLVPPVDQERLRKQREAEIAAQERAERRAARRARALAKARAEQRAAAAAASVPAAAPSVDGDPFNILQ